MIKKSYIDGTSEITTPAPPESDFGGNGPIIAGMVSEYDDSKREDESENERDILNKAEGGGVLDILINISDELDRDGLDIYANFSDFLIKKFGEALNEDPTKLFNELILKIKRSDIADTSQVIKKITKIYSRTILLENMKNNNLKKSKESAYKKVLHRASQYLSEA